MFSSEFIVLNTCMENIVALRCKLIMFGIPILEETSLLCDNNSTLKSSSLLESKLHKKDIYTAYHAVQWVVAAGTAVVRWIDTSLNIADAFTKRLSCIHREKLFGYWTY